MVWLKRWGSFAFPNVLAVCVALSGCIAASPAGAGGNDDKLARLEARLAELEKRLARAVPRPSRKARPAIVARPPSPVAEAPEAEPAAGSAAAAAKQTRDLTPSEFSVFRDNAATLGKQKLEAAIGFAYTKRSALFQSDRNGSAFVDLRYGIFDGVELSLNVPAYFNKRVTELGPSSTTGVVSGIGDVTAKLSALIFKETPDLPGVVATIGVTAPTGSSPLYFPGPFVLGGVPFNLFKSYGSRGAWAGSSNLQVYKTLDPIVVFAGIGYEHTFASTFLGYHVRWGEVFNYNAGFAFAVNEKTTIGFQVNGAVQNQLYVNGVKSPGTKSEPITARLVVVQRIYQDAYLEPSVGFALSNDAPDVTLGVTLRRRF